MSLTAFNKLVIMYWYSGLVLVESWYHRHFLAYQMLEDTLSLFPVLLLCVALFIVVLLTSFIGKGALQMLIIIIVITQEERHVNCLLALRVCRRACAYGGAVLSCGPYTWL